jgi:hypothetical protein
MLIITSFINTYTASLANKLVRKKNAPVDELVHVRRLGRMMYSRGWVIVEAGGRAPWPWTYGGK